MDPITLATATSAITTLAVEVAKGTASEVGKDVWSQIKKLFGWRGQPPDSELAPTVARRLVDDAALARQVVTLLQQHPTGPSSALVGSIDAEKVVVAGEINVSGDFKM